MNACVWWWQQYAKGAIDAYAARIGCRSYLIFTVYVVPALSRDGGWNVTSGTPSQ